MGCDFRWLKASDLFENVDKTKEYVNWSDIIYEGGGDTVAMIDLWLKTGFDVLLKAAWESGKVMCGISAGAICWFSCGITDHPEYLDKEINCINGLGLVDAYFCPHCDKEGKRERINRSLKYIEKVGLSVSNCCAIEIIDDKYRIIKSTPADSARMPYALRTYWNNGELVEEEIDVTSELKPLNTLLMFDA